MNSPLPATVEVETGPNPSASVIWLHGLGADGHDFEPAVPALTRTGPGPDHDMKKALKRT